ncbi:MAG: hypothetical protein ACI4T1_00230 [Christensenellales bacterium]
MATKNKLVISVGLRIRITKTITTKTNMKKKTPTTFASKLLKVNNPNKINEP